MDLGTNPTPAINVLREAELLSDAQGSPLDEKTIEDFAARIPAKLAAAFINNVIQLKSGSANDTIEISESALETNYRMTERLVQRPDVKAVLFDTPHLTTYNFSDTDTKPPHIVALLQNDFKMFELLMENGANIEQSYSVIDITGETRAHFDIHSLRANWQNVLDTYSPKEPLTGIANAFTKIALFARKRYFPIDTNELQEKLNRIANHLDKPEKVPDAEREIT